MGAAVTCKREQKEHLLRGTNIRQDQSTVRSSDRIIGTDNGRTRREVATSDEAQSGSCHSAVSLRYTPQGQKREQQSSHGSWICSFPKVGSSATDRPSGLTGPAVLDDVDHRGNRVGWLRKSSEEHPGRGANVCGQPRGFRTANSGATAHEHSSTRRAINIKQEASRAAEKCVKSVQYRTRRK
ncbi:hypothetical protein L227DRAFT_48125 [Lentinus tigrinus ALCF2SS1-6]|uniref:Uncharacterized protein n=1 Tax=Lentinus tigrinus ALCF2SS1-6 TaxID=1328759 RepID=A0A5C2SE48_9APHY|nr:hypothetical protein L227DRAFT_48125 [Lentinus tigrinus ALCF2SS1-6]